MNAYLYPQSGLQVCKGWNHGANPLMAPSVQLIRLKRLEDLCRLFWRRVSGNSGNTENHSSDGDQLDDYIVGGNLIIDYPFSC